MHSIEAAAQSVSLLKVLGKLRGARSTLFKYSYSKIHANPFTGCSSTVFHYNQPDSGQMMLGIFLPQFSVIVLMVVHLSRSTMSAVGRNFNIRDKDRSKTWGTFCSLAIQAMKFFLKKQTYTSP